MFAHIPAHTYRSGRAHGRLPRTARRHGERAEARRGLPVHDAGLLGPVVRVEGTVPGTRPTPNGWPSPCASPACRTDRPWQEPAVGRDVLRLLVPRNSAARALVCQSAELDGEIRERFLALHERHRRGAMQDAATPRAAARRGRGARPVLAQHVPRLAARVCRPIRSRAGWRAQADRPGIRLAVSRPRNGSFSTCPSSTARIAKTRRSPAN